MEDEEKKENREQDPNPATLDYLVASYDPHWSYDGPFLKPLHPQGEIYMYIIKRRLEKIDAVKEVFREKPNTGDIMFLR